MRALIVTLSSLILLNSVSTQEVNEACKDNQGRSHRIGESYTAPDGCNYCKCLDTGSACTRKFCTNDDKDSASSSRVNEATMCYDNEGRNHEIGESYTHVDGCNICTCGQDGGRCTRRFCLREPRELGCKQTEGVWIAEDGCNKCMCGPFGPVCTREYCGEHSSFTDNDKDAEINEFIHTKLGTVVNEDGDIPCRDYNGTEQWPGNSWLSADGCNICSCKGDGVPSCTKMGCRERFARLINDGNGVGVMTMSLPALLATVIVTVIVRLY